MPKMKVHKGSKRRFRVTAGGKVKHRRPNTSHLMSGKSSKRRRTFRKPGFLKSALERRVKLLLGPRGV